MTSAPESRARVGMELPLVRQEGANRRVVPLRLLNERLVARLLEQDEPCARHQGLELHGVPRYRDAVEAPGQHESGNGDRPEASTKIDRREVPTEDDVGVRSGDLK